MSSIKFFNPEGYVLPSQLQDYFYKIFDYMVLNYELPNYPLEIVFLSKEEIQKLNKKYKNKDYPTDVLSWNFLNDSYNQILGVFCFCLPVIKENNSNVLYELSFLFIHSCLHLLGFNHGKEMFKIQDLIIKNFFDKN